MLNERNKAQAKLVAFEDALKKLKERVATLGAKNKELASKNTMLIDFEKEAKIVADLLEKFVEHY